MQIRLRWLSATVCKPTWLAALNFVVALTRRQHPEVQLTSIYDGLRRDPSGAYLTRIAEALEADAVLAPAWRLLALLPHDPTLKRWETVAAVQGLLKLSDGDITESMLRLDFWKSAQFVEGGPTDFFRIAEVEWATQARAAPNNAPVCVRLLEQDTWREAFDGLFETTVRVAGPLGITPPAWDLDRKKQRIQIAGLVETLFAQHLEECGDLALAWQMMTCDPERPESFNSVLPQLTWLLNNCTIVTQGRLRRLHDRLQVWWLAARGEWAGAKQSVSTFRIAVRETAEILYDEQEEQQPEPAQPTVVVMRKDRADEKGMPQAWKDLRDESLPLVLCKDAAKVRELLQAEYPHAVREIAMLTQDLRSGEPVRIRPTILLSPPGTGKTRMIRKLAEIISPDIYVSRFDAASAFDGMYGGTPKGWSSAHPSVPAKAIMASRTANPIVLVDEIEKASESTHNGNLWSAMTPLLDKETSRRYRESGIDAELDLSHVVHLATANSVERLPSQLRDRMRVIRIPTPTLAHLPQLAALVMRDLAAEDEARAHDEPLALDELEIIGRAWARERFSMRKLQRLVAATLEARDAFARRH
ncbi:MULTISPECIES: AAA family ATPase [Bradyrhizobium]|uniref:AAA family ATPase n=1 Tax=Bradyrhizobium TaxID=374 RepID=UPI001EDC774D|nr:AAA family ATPase [Bradyrhizobium zhengyangense]MCG2643765.1 AAA family ATPase [Bradyrhizobium zhengyangense]